VAPAFRRHASLVAGEVTGPVSEHQTSTTQQMHAHVGKMPHCCDFPTKRPLGPGGRRAGMAWGMFPGPRSRCLLVVVVSDETVIIRVDRWGEEAPGWLFPVRKLIESIEHG
jgi:hypothetical protein